MATSPDTASFSSEGYPSSQRDNSNMTDTPTRQLDFYQAMTDFKQMFPNLDEEVIEAVLRANNGAVDATIDQLLTMTVDSGDHTDHPERPHPPHPQTVELSSSEDEDVPPYPPPSYNEYSNMPPIMAHGTPTRLPPSDNNKSATFTSISQNDILLDMDGPGFDSPEIQGATGFSMDSTPVKKVPPPFLEDEFPPSPPMPPKMSLIEHDYTVKKKPMSGTQPPPMPKKLYRDWNPPMLGSLPEDFLRVVLLPHQMKESDRPSKERHQERPSSATSSPAHVHRPSHSMSSPGPNSPSWSPSRSRSSTPRSEQGARSRTSGSGSRSISAQHGTEELNSQVIARKMEENERKQSLAGGDMSSHEAQMLADERMALMMQNEEFIDILQTDEEFMRALERDRMNAAAFEPPSPFPHEASTNGAKPKEEGYRINQVAIDAESPVLDSNRPASDQFEGYGDDQQRELGAFPFSQPAPQDENDEFKRQLKHMGGSSKKKFMSLARKFFTVKKKKKNPKHLILKDSIAPSTANLLEEEYDDEELLPREEHPPEESASSLSSVPNHMTIQRPLYSPDVVITRNKADPFDVV